MSAPGASPACEAGRCRKGGETSRVSARPPCPVRWRYRVMSISSGLAPPLLRPVIGRLKCKSSESLETLAACAKYSQHFVVRNPLWHNGLCLLALLASAQRFRCVGQSHLQAGTSAFVGWDKRSAVPPRLSLFFSGGTALRLSHPTFHFRPCRQRNLPHTMNAF
jgi:hypothetical protein